MLCKTSLNPVLSSVASFTSFECMNVKLKCLDTVINFAVIKRPPCIQNVPVSMFFEEFLNYLEIIIASDGKLLVGGDFNFLLDDAKMTIQSHAQNSSIYLVCGNMYLSLPTHILTYWT